MGSGPSEEPEAMEPGVSSKEPEAAQSSAVADAAKRRDEKTSKRDAVEYEKHRMRDTSLMTLPAYSVSKAGVCTGTRARGISL